METRSRMSRSLHTNRDFEKLEPYEGKPSRTVLRGEEGSNALDLPDKIFPTIPVVEVMVTMIAAIRYKDFMSIFFKFDVCTVVDTILSVRFIGGR